MLISKWSRNRPDSYKLLNKLCVFNVGFPVNFWRGMPVRREAEPAGALFLFRKVDNS